MRRPTASKADKMTNTSKNTSKDFRTKTKGQRLTVNFGGRKRATFTAGGRKRYLVAEEYNKIGQVMVNGEIRFADGTIAHALLEIDESSSGEHGGTGVWFPDGEVVFQNEKGFKAALAKHGVTNAFPYQYRYTGDVRADDHHIGEDGWSL